MKKIVIFFLFAAILLAKTLAPVKYDPFFRAQKLLKKQEKDKFIQKKPFEIKVYAIYNDRAYINGKFYKTGDFIAGYKIYKIAKNYIVLKKKSKFKIKYLVKSDILKIRKKQ